MRKKWQTVANWWQTYATQNFLAQASSMHPYKEAYLSKPADNDLKKKWFVTFWVYSQEKKELVRKRIAVTGRSIPEREALADELIAEINEKLQNGLIADPVVEKKLPVKFSPNIRLIDALKFFQQLKDATLKDKSSETYRSNKANFESFLKYANLTEIRMRDFDEGYAHAYLDWVKIAQKLSNKSHNRIKGYASAVFNEFVDRKVIEANPFKKISKLIATQGGHRVFMPEQIQEFKQSCIAENDDATWFFACFIYYTFLRPHEEARYLKVEDIKEHTITINEVNAKMSRIRHVRIPPGLEVMLQERKIRSYPPHYYIFSHQGVPSPNVVGDNYWYMRHRVHLMKMGLYKQGYDLYGWKHTGVCALYRATLDLLLVQEQCGHSDVKQTIEYLRDLGVFHYSGQIEKFPPI